MYSRYARAGYGLSGAVSSTVQQGFRNGAFEHLEAVPSLRAMQLRSFQEEGGFTGWASNPLYAGEDEELDSAIALSLELSAPVGSVDGEVSSAAGASSTAPSKPLPASRMSPLELSFHLKVTMPTLESVRQADSLGRGRPHTSTSI